jgi:hypothetical protein
MCHDGVTAAGRYPLLRRREAGFFLLLLCRFDLGGFFYQFDKVVDDARRL